MDEELVTSDNFDLESFKKDVALYVRQIRSWKRECKGYSVAFEGKPFQKVELVLKKKTIVEIEIPEVNLAPELPDQVLPEPVVPEQKRFKDLSKSRQRAKSEALRNSEDPDLLMKAVHQLLRSSNVDAGVVFRNLQEDPKELGTKHLLF